MQGQELVCPVCYDEFDSKKKAPRVIPTCGHTICTYCLEKILGSYTKKCPLDKQWLPNDKYYVNNYPVNYILSQAMENKLEVRICEVHKEPLQMACFTDNCMVCEDCVWQGDHKDHQVKTIKKVRKDLLAKNHAVEERITHVDEIFNKLKEKMTQSKQAFESDIKKKFAEVNKLLAEKEKAYLLQSTLLYCEGMRKLENFIGGKSELKQNISQKIDWMNTNFQGNEFFELYNIDFSAFLSKIDSLLSMIPHGEYKVDITPTLEAFNHSFGELEGLVSKHDVSFATLLDQITSFEPKISINSFEDIPLLPCFEVKSCVEIVGKDSEGVLEMFTRKRDAVDQKLDGSLWRKNHELRVNFENYELTEEDEKTLEYVFQKLPRLKNLKLNFAPGGDFDDNKLIDIFSTILVKPQEIEEIEIDLEKCKVGDRSLMVFLEKYLPLMPNLRGLGLNLSATEVTSKTIETFVSEHGGGMFKNLTKFKLYLNKIGTVDDSLMGQLCVAMPKMASLHLGFAGSKITGKALENFSKNTVMGTFKNLKTLELDFSETAIQEKFLGMVFANLSYVKNLKEFGLNLRKTPVTDFVVTRLVEVGLPKLGGGLTNLNVDLRDSKVTLKAMAQLDKIKKKVTPRNSA